LEEVLNDIVQLLFGCVLEEYRTKIVIGILGAS
jgi:hypothetical protein